MKAKVADIFKKLQATEQAISELICEGCQSNGAPLNRLAADREMLREVLHGCESEIEISHAVDVLTVNRQAKALDEVQQQTQVGKGERR